MRTFAIFLIYAWLLWFSQPCLASDVLKAGDNITVNGRILVSAGQKFALGFFSLTGTSLSYYIGIWYYSDPLTVIWVANRESPVNSAGVFKITEHGNLVIEDDSDNTYWSSNLGRPSSTTNRTAILTDDGNLMLQDQRTKKYIWQSFQHPTDTLLPEMKMDEMTNLTCWKDSNNEPGTGNFAFKMSSSKGGDNRYVIFDTINQRRLYWESQKSGEINSNATFGLIVQLLTNFSLNTNPVTNNSRLNSIIVDIRLLMNSNGELQILTRNSTRREWSVKWKASANISELPVCTESEDCVGWSHSSCKGTSSGSKRCLCDSNYRWDGLSLNCTIKEDTSLGGKPSSEEPKLIHEGNSKSSLPLILGITLTSAVVLACAIVFGYVLKRKQRDSESIQRNRLRFFDSERHVKDLIDVSELEERDNEGIEVPFYDFESILLATNNFSDENKLGRGGYGPVYKGKLQGGEVIAVKRLSSVSAQGLKEFKNEVVLIAKLQHRNLVRLRGYCIKREEKILLYEYMPNGSLDLVIFDSTRSALLDWQMRFDIIVGIARGLLYLHQDSRLRVIHRDLKTSNILLDEEMQPKISDFGLARIVGGKETEANTERVVGTYGYMSPEYALDGLFSTKSDIFSFGVLLLEIISGKKNTGFYDKSKQISSLLGYAWRLYTENKLIDLMDMSLAETCNVHQFTKCAQIGLLCVQDEPGDRPTMSNVVTMLDSETATLPTPKQPTFFASRGQSSTASSSKPEASLHFESSYQEGR